MNLFSFSLLKSFIFTLDISLLFGTYSSLQNGFNPFNTLGFGPTPLTPNWDAIVIHLHQ